MICVQSKHPTQQFVTSFGHINSSHGYWSRPEVTWKGWWGGCGTVQMCASHKNLRRNNLPESRIVCIEWAKVVPSDDLQVHCDRARSLLCDNYYYRQFIRLIATEIFRRTQSQQTIYDLADSQTSATRRGDQYPAIIIVHRWIGIG